MANLTSTTEHVVSSTFDLYKAALRLQEAEMKTIRRAKAIRQKATKFESSLNTEQEHATWLSVMADAEQRMAELRRTIEWAREFRTGLASPITPAIVHQ